MNMAAGKMSLFKTSVLSTINFRIFTVLKKSNVHEIYISVQKKEIVTDFKQTFNII